VHATWHAGDRCDPQPRADLVSVTSSESAGVLRSPRNVTAESSDTTLFLRAARSSAGPGRVYTLTFVATDASGNSVTKALTVSVPHDQRRASSVQSPGVGRP
jgi:hypothetical protein